jgi:16S rRNA processing protein RimM
MENAPPRRIAVARLLRPQGRRGELLAEPLTDLPDILTPGRAVELAAPAKPAATTLSSTTVESAWHPTGRNAGRIVLKLTGCDSITDAELLAGRELFLPQSDLPALDPGTWFVSDLLGCTLFDDRSPVGEITGIQYAMAADGRTRLEDAAPLLEVTPPAGPNTPEPALVPFIKAWLETVDLDNHRVVMHLPPGLLTSQRETPNSKLPTPN